MRLEGVFWQLETPERRVRGQLELSDGGAPVLETFGRIFDERAYRITHSQHGGTTIVHSGNSDDLVADFQPRNIHGGLRDGRRVSLVEAQGGADVNGFFDRQYRQKFQARHVVMEEHEPTTDPAGSARSGPTSQHHRTGRTAGPGCTTGCSPNTTRASTATPKALPPFKRGGVGVDRDSGTPLTAFPARQISRQVLGQKSRLGCAGVQF